MFRAFGHNNSSVLNGGLPRWEAEGLPIETSAPEDLAPLEPAPEVAEYDQAWIKSMNVFLNWILAIANRA